MFRCYLLLLLALLTPFTYAQDKPAKELRTGLVLSGGGARGLAHIGVLKQLEQQNIPIHAIAGTSMGAVIGGLYAAGYSADELQQIALELDWQTALSDAPLREDIPYRRKQDDRDFLVKQRLTFKQGSLRFPLGILQGQNLGLILESLLVHTNDINDFDKLPIPFRAVATDIATGEAVVFNSGHLPQAIRASIGLPGFFAPVMLDGRMLVDGVLSKNLPVDVAREMGVDRVIVVDIATPLKPASAMHSLLDIMDQTTTLLTRNNTQEQLATLGEQDLLLQPELGNIAFSSFSDAEQAITAGAQSLVDAPTLQAFTDSSHITTHPGGNLASNRPSRQPIINEIRIINSGKVDDKVVRSMIRQQIGQPLNTGHLATDMGTIYGTDYFSRVNYEILHDDDHNTLLIRTSGRETGTDYLRLGLNLVDDFEGGSQFTIGASFRVNGVNPLGAEWLTRLQMGEHQRLYSEFYQPLDYGSRFFLAPFIDAEARNVEVILDNDPVADYRLQRYGTGLNFGRQIANNGEVRLGLSRYRGQSKIRVGDPDQPTLKFDEAFYSLAVERDTLDNVNFPTSGDAARILWRQSEPALGADDRYRQIELRGNKAFSYNNVHSVQLGAFLGRTNSHVDVAQSSFILGGPGEFSGFRQGGLAGQNYNLARAVYYRRMTSNKLSLSMPIYLGGTFEYGRVYNKGADALDTGYISAGSLLLGMDTLLGPLFFGLGTNTEGERALYMNLGQTF